MPRTSSSRRSRGRHGDGVAALQRPQHQLWRPVVVALPALAAGSLRPPAVRIAASALAALATVWLAFGLSPLDARPFDSGHHFSGQPGSRSSAGFLDFYDVRLPFDPARMRTSPPSFSS